ncbi:hypothetical protein ESCO_000101 [Escovopsis weberi]|uniref:C6 transcription factor n=1 Tax=Escovopsis weberi TaxID=150374 RepID=A0A0M8MY27_ESCWE|nr:hypothetical protein ESCO_000101 [Escovopsis weberi]
MVNTRSASRAGSAGPNSRTQASPPPPPTPKRTPNSLSPASSTSNLRASSKKSLSSRFAHVPTTVTLGWLAVSLPLVVWDTIYTLGRPHTMEGGWLHDPLWIPYRLYGEIDHVYGWKAFNAGNGFTSAQGLLNAVETALYLWYLVAWLTASTTAGAPAANGKAGGRKGAAAAKEVKSQRVLSGRTGALALLVGFSAAVMTVSKTVLYWANEYYSGFDNIGHNTMQDLVFLWIIPNGAWLVFPTYMIISLGMNLVDGLAGAV